MATPTAPGFPTSFDADAFRNAITGAMQMGTPTLASGAPDPEKRAIFIKKASGKTYKDSVGTLIWEPGDPLASKPRTDRDGRPFDPTIRVDDVEPERVTDADVAVEIERADADEIPVGNFRDTKAVVTVLDETYTKIQGCRELLFNGDRYLYGYEPDNVGLFNVGVHTLIFYAVDES